MPLKENFPGASGAAKQLSVVLMFPAERIGFPVSQRFSMTKEVGHEITELLKAWRQGDEQALEKLTPQVYRELHRAAKRCMQGERDGHTLQTTALINELYLRMTDLKRVDWQNRAHFFAICARQMRRILTDQARARQSHKRGGGAQPISLEAAPVVSAQSHPEVLAVDGALNALGKIDPRKSQVVELRFFGGLNVEEIAEVLKVSHDTVVRDWRMAKAWLLRELSQERLDGC
jgi:RNA polymerase sigma-70 factor, ECF subfamily